MVVDIMDDMPFSYKRPQYVPNKPQPSPDMDSDADFGVIGDILSGAGHALDLPGSMVRDAISFSNPFDQVMTPFSGENRTTGADISRYWMGGDADSAGNQMAGLMIDVLTDPTILATGGTSAAARMGMKGAGQVAKGAGKVAGAAKGGYAAGKKATTGGKLMQQNKNLARRAGLQDQNAEVFSRAAEELPLPGLGRPESLTRPTQTRQALASAIHDSAAGIRGQMMSDEAIGAATELANKNLGTRFNNATMPIREGAYRGADQFARDAYGGARAGLGALRDSAEGLGRGIMAGDRNAMLQGYGIGSNAMRTMTGQRMEQEPNIEDMIAQAIMEDPELGQQLLMMLTGEQ